MYTVIIATMVGAGVLGGAINTILSRSLPLKDGEPPLPGLGAHIVLGVGAALIIPLFLSMISSGLVGDLAKGNELTPELFAKLLVLVGFCLLAAISSRAFLQSMTQRLLREVAEAKRMAREAKEDAGQARSEAGAAVRIVEDARPKLEALAAS